MMGIDQILNTEIQSALSPVIRVDHIAVVSRQSNKIRILLGKLGILKRWAGIVPEIKVNCEYYSLLLFFRFAYSSGSSATSSIRRPPV